VLAVGGVDPAALGPIPPNVEVHAHVPQLAVLRRARVFVTPAGMGSTMESLYFGVPMVAVPQMAEQWQRRPHRRGRRCHGGGGRGGEGA
jgi:UDP:flavonoid glycosyltransferase YjiC (YdhE family)